MNVRWISTKACLFASKLHSRPLMWKLQISWVVQMLTKHSQSHEHRRRFSTTSTTSCLCQATAQRRSTPSGTKPSSTSRCGTPQEPFSWLVYVLYYHILLGLSLTSVFLSSAGTGEHGSLQIGWDGLSALCRWSPTHYHNVTGIIHSVCPFLIPIFQLKMAEEGFFCS